MCRAKYNTQLIKAIRQYLLTCKVSRYCLLVLHGGTEVCVDVCGMLVMACLP